MRHVGFVAYMFRHAFLSLRLWHLGFWFHCPGFWVEGPGCRVLGLRFFGFRFGVAGFWV